jgi:hypothetical protein
MPRSTAADTVGAGTRTGAGSVMMAGRSLAATNQERVIVWRASVELIVRCVTRTCTGSFAWYRVMQGSTVVGTVGAGSRTGAASVMMTVWALAATNQERVIAWRASV